MMRVRAQIRGATYERGTMTDLYAAAIEVLDAAYAYCAELSRAALVARYAARAAERLRHRGMFRARFFLPWRAERASTQHRVRSHCPMPLGQDITCHAHI